MQNKERFIKELKDQLKGMNPKIKEEIIYDYEEHFKEGLAKGVSEEEIIQKLGSPQRIASQYRLEEAIDKAEEKLTPQGVFRAILVGLQLSLFNMIFVLVFFISLLAGLFAMIVSSLAIGFAGLVSMIQALLPSQITWFEVNALLDLFNLTLGSPSARILLFGSGILFVLIGALLAVLFGFLTKWFIKGTLNYIKTNVKIVQNVSRLN